MRLAAVVLALVLVVPRGFGADADLKALVQREYPSLEELYKTIHRNPELSRQESQTSKLLADELRKAGYVVTENVGKYADGQSAFGVVGVLKNGEGPVLLIRGDMDALPVKEETGAEYASTVTSTDPQGATVPVMHACGHDVHVTCLVGTARAMAAMKEKWTGTLVLIGQPAEEVVAGARAMLNAGLFEKFPRPNYALALHVDGELELGKIGYTSGYSHAYTDSVDITIRGVGGHGAQPHTTKDPIVISAQVILALQTIDSRIVHPLEPVVVTVGSIHGGSKHNIISDEVKMQLTVRTQKDEVRQQVLEAIKQITAGIAMANGIPENLAPVVTLNREGVPSQYNTPELVERVVKVLKKTVGDDNVVPKPPTMGGEDFGLFGRQEPRIPLFMFRLGSVAPEKVAESKREGGKKLPSLHSSKYLPERDCIQVGVTTMTSAAMDLLKK